MSSLYSRLSDFINLSKRMNTLSDRRYLVACSTMQGLCLNNNEREKTVNGYFTNTANGDVVQSPEMWGSEEKTFGRLS